MLFSSPSKTSIKKLFLIAKDESYTRKQEPTALTEIPRFFTKKNLLQSYPKAFFILSFALSYYNFFLLLTHF